MYTLVVSHHHIVSGRKDLELHASSPLSGYIKSGTLLSIDFSPLRPACKDGCLTSLWFSSFTLLSDTDFHYLENTCGHTSSTISKVLPVF